MLKTLLILILVLEKMRCGHWRDWADLAARSFMKILGSELTWWSRFKPGWIQRLWQSPWEHHWHKSSVESPKDETTVFIMCLQPWHGGTKILFICSLPKNHKSLIRRELQNIFEVITWKKMANMDFKWKIFLHQDDYERLWSCLWQLVQTSWYSKGIWCHISCWKPWKK